MGTLQKLKAYFGMVPADEYDGYDLDDYDGHGAMDYRSGYRRPDYLDDEDDYEPYQRPRRRLFGRGYRDEVVDDYDNDFGQDFADRVDTELVGRADFPRRPVAPVARTRSNWSADAPVQGALAMDPRTQPPVRQTRPTPVETPPVPAAQPAAQPSSSGYPMGRIVTLHPKGFTEARTIGEHYRDGTPVIINLTEMDDADARRLVDFAAGLAFAMRGAMDKVTNKVFLISPPNVDPTAEDKRRIAEGGLLNRG
jgi:cell division inhibitor SepF